MDRPRRDSRQHNGITVRGLSQLTFATKSATSSHSITAHDANEPSLSDQAPPMQRATINHLSSETALPNRSRIAECRRKSQNIVALAGFASVARLLSGSLLLLFFACQYRPSACWYFCWYRRQSATKTISNSISYDTRRLSARGTKLKIPIKTIT
jgi:hypothetical protein